MHQNRNVNFRIIAIHFYSLLEKVCNIDTVHAVPVGINRVGTTSVFTSVLHTEFCQQAVSFGISTVLKDIPSSLLDRLRNRRLLGNASLDGLRCLRLDCFSSLDLRGLDLTALGRRYPLVIASSRSAVRHIPILGHSLARLYGFNLIAEKLEITDILGSILALANVGINFVGSSRTLGLQKVKGDKEL
jgi:hypothetical protein